MSKADDTSSGSNSNPSGASEGDNPENQNAAGSSQEGKKDTVSYDTYQKVLSEKKKAAERVAALESEKKKREEAELLAKEDYKKILESREKELADSKAELEKIKARESNALKLRAVLEGLSGDVEREYYDLIPIAGIAIDPETGLPDPASVREAVRTMETKYAKVITKKASGLPPGDAAQGASGKLTYEQWAKLPDKEKPARMKDVDKSTM